MRPKADAPCSSCGTSNGKNKSNGKCQCRDLSTASASARTPVEMTTLYRLRNRTDHETALRDGLKAQAAVGDG
jgi:hypothetical protein